MGCIDVSRRKPCYPRQAMGWTVGQTGHSLEDAGHSLVSHLLKEFSTLVKLPDTRFKLCSPWYLEAPQTTDTYVYVFIS